MELTSVGVFLRTVRYSFVNLLALGDITRICGNDEFLVPVDDGMVRQRLTMNIFRLLNHMHWDSSLAF